MMQKILQYLFYTWVFLLPWQTVLILREVYVEGEKWQLGTLLLYVSDLFLICFVLGGLWFYRRVLAEYLKKQKYNKFLWLVVGWLVWLALGVLWAEDALLVAQHVLWIVCGLGAIGISAVLRPRVRIVMAVLVGSLLLQGLLGIGQFLWQGDFENKYLGTTKHVVYAGGTSVVEAQGERWLRAYGGMSHPNVFGGMMFVAALVALGGNLRAQQKKWQALYVIASSIFVVGMMMSFSRSAMLALFACIGVMGILVYRGNSCKQKNAMAVYSVIAAMIISIFVIVHSNLFVTRMSAETRLEQKSLNERVLQVTEAREMISANPIVGVGTGNYTKKLQEMYPEKPVWTLQPVHNVILLYVAETGLIGGLLGVVIFLSSIAYIWQKRYNSERFDVVWLVATFGLFLLSFMDHWLWSSHIGIMVAALCIAMTRNIFSHKKV